MLGDKRADVLRGFDSRLGVWGFTEVGGPLEGPILERTLRIPVFLEAPACERSPLFPPIPLLMWFFMVRTSSFDVGGPGVAPSRRSPSLSFLHLEQRLGAGRGSGEVGGDKVS